MDALAEVYLSFRQSTSRRAEDRERVKSRVTGLLERFFLAILNTFRHNRSPASLRWHSASRKYKSYNRLVHFCYD